MVVQYYCNFQILAVVDFIIYMKLPKYNGIVLQSILFKIIILG